MGEDGFKISVQQVVAALVVAAGIAAAVWGFGQERHPVATEWRPHAVAENNFTVDAPGVFIVNKQPMDFEGTEVSAQTYQASDLGMDYSVLVARRPDSDMRSVAQVAKDMRLSGAGAGEDMGGLVVFHHDVAVEGRRTQAVVYFQDRLMYQLMASARTQQFSPPQSVRFLNSFHLLNPTLAPR